MRLISFYLPQFHEDEENNKNWGKGFTEWDNLRNAKSLFPKHNVIFPSELGYYDLSQDSVRHAQASLAQEYGISAWCYYYYRFQEKRPLYMPLDKHFKDKSLSMPFLICWANENWTRSWAGLAKDILIQQKHTPEDDSSFIKEISLLLMDERYFRIDGKPVILIYRTELWSDIKKTVDVWRNYMKYNFATDIYLVRCHGFDTKTNPYEINFDASYQFPPFGMLSGFMGKNNLVGFFNYNSWTNLVEEKKPYKLFRGVMTSFDNTPRRKNLGDIYLNANPDNYKNWLKNSIIFTKKNFVIDEQIIFINAWNEWGEGAALEPSNIWGRKYLQATKECLYEN